MYASETPSGQREWRSVHPSSRFAFAFEAPRISPSARPGLSGDDPGEPAGHAVRRPRAECSCQRSALARKRGLVHEPMLGNGDPGAVFYGPDGRALWVTASEIADGVAVAVRSVLNPYKLAHVPAGP
jgi:hypothetical protein